MKNSRIVSFYFDNGLYNIRMTQLTSSNSYYIIEMIPLDPFLFYMKDTGIWASNNPDIASDFLQMIGYHAMIYFYSEQEHYPSVVDKLNGGSSV
jgi:hypothetical protein